MPITYPSATKNARMNAVVTLLASGKLKLFASDGTTLLGTFILAATAGVVTGDGVLTLSDANAAASGVLSTTASAAGTAEKATLTTSADVDVITGLTVGISKADIILDNNVLTLNKAITINSAKLTHTL